MGPCRNQPPPLSLLSLPLPLFPSASAWEISALQSHTRAKGVLLGLIFFKFEFPGASGWEAEDVPSGRLLLLRLAMSAFWVAGEKRHIPCSVGPRLLKWGVSPREKEVSALDPLPPKFKPQTEEPWTLGLGKFPTCAPSPSPAPPPTV